MSKLILSEELFQLYFLCKELHKCNGCICPRIIKQRLYYPNSVLLVLISGYEGYETVYNIVGGDVSVVVLVRVLVLILIVGSTKKMFTKFALRDQLSIFHDRCLAGHNPVPYFT